MERYPFDEENHQNRSADAADAAATTEPSRSSLSLDSAQKQERAALVTTNSSSSSRSQAHDPGNQKESLWLKAWLPELLAWVFSLLCFGAIVVLLAIYDHRPLHDWKSPINLNTFIALLATVGTACLAAPVSSALGQTKWARFRTRQRPVTQFQAIEEAGRGAFGSVLLLIKRRSGFIAGLGAVLTILLLAIGPFVQQVVSYESSSFRAGEASILTSTAYGEDSNGDYNPFLDSDSQMWAAMYIALFSPPTASFQMKSTCPTGNCTWPLYQSLAFCASCANLTELLNLGKHKDDYQNWALPNGFGLFGYDAWYKSGHFIEFNMTTAAESIAFQHAGSVLVDVQAINKLGMDYKNTHVTAVECILQACVNTYNTTAVESQVFEVVVDSWTNSSITDHSNNLIMKPPGTNTTYTITNGLVRWLETSLESLFTGTRGDYVTYEGGDLVPTLEYDAAAYPDSFFDLMTNLARSMSIAARGENEWTVRANATGDAYKMDIFIRVSWIWLTLPLCLVLFVFFFVVLVMTDTKKKRIEVWKNNIIASMTYGFDDNTRELLAGTHNIIEAEEEAARLDVQLEYSKGYWRLQQSEAPAVARDSYAGT